MKNFLRLTLFAVVAMMCGTAMAETTVTWSAAEGGSLTAPVAVDDNITLTWTESSGDQSPKIVSNYVYFYNGNQVKINTTSNYKLTKIVFSFADDKTSLQILNGGGSYTQGTWTGETDVVTFRAAKQTGVRKITSIEVTYKAEGEVVEQKADLTMTAFTINATADLDNTPSVYVEYKNNGNAATENAKATLYVDGTENASATIGTLAAGGTGWKQVYYNAAAIEAGDHTVYVELSADNDGGNGVKKSETKTVTFSKKAPEASFSVTAENVTVAYDATSYSVTAHVTNTSEVDATGVEVKLYNSGTVMAQTSVDVPAGQTVDATLTVENGPFAAGRTQMQIVAGNASQWIWVVVEEAPVVDVIDLAITDIAGTIELGKDENTVRVSVQNNGNVNITDAVVTLTAGEKTLGTATVSAYPGRPGFCSVSVDKTGLEAGELEVTATVTVEGDENPDDNTLTQTIEVVAAPAPVASFELTAQDIEVEFAQETIQAVVNVKNTSEVAAENVELHLWYNGTIATATIEALAAGETKAATFSFANPFTKAGTYEVQALTADNKYGCKFNITVKEAPVTPVIDMELTAIQGLEKIDLTKENKIQVWYKNNSNVDVETATISVKLNDTALDAQTISNVKVEGTGWVEFVLPTTGLTAGTNAKVVAEIAAQNDVNAENDKLEKEYEVIDGVPAVATFTVSVDDVEVEFDAEQADVLVKVKNTSEVAATEVVVDIYLGTKVIARETVDNIAANEEKEVTLSILLKDMQVAPGTYELQAVVNNAASTFFNLTVKPEPVVPVVDLEITSISGSIDLSAETNFLTVFIENKGNVDIREADLTLTTGETVLGSATISARAGEEGNTGFASVQVDHSTLQVGEIEVTAKVQVGENVFEYTETVTVTNTTSIMAVKAQLGENAEVYTIDGQKVNSLKKGGLYIVNGKKMLVK